MTVKVFDKYNCHIIVAVTSWLYNITNLVYLNILKVVGKLPPNNKSEKKKKTNPLKMPRKIVGVILASLPKTYLTILSISVNEVLYFICWLNFETNQNVLSDLLIELEIRMNLLFFKFSDVTFSLNIIIIIMETLIIIFGNNWDQRCFAYLFIYYLF